MAATIDQDDHIFSDAHSPERRLESLFQWYIDTFQLNVCYLHLCYLLLPPLHLEISAVKFVFITPAEDLVCKVCDNDQEQRE